MDKKNNDIEQLEVETPHEFVVRDELREKRKNIKTFEDLVAFIKSMYSSEGGGKDVVKTLENLVDKGKLHNVYFIICKWGSIIIYFSTTIFPLM